MTINELENKIQDIEIALSSNPDPTTKKKLEQGLSIFNDLLLAERQKKTESQPTGKTEQLEQQNERRLPTKEELQAWQKGMEKEIQETHEEIANMQGDEKAEFLGKKLVTQYANMVEREQQFKTIKAPAIDREPEYINIELTDQKSAKYIRTYNRAQTKSLCRKYFSNVHSAWLGGNRKLTNGFDNLLAYFLGWAEFDGKKPELQDVLQDYFRYKKATEQSEDSTAFKVAKELYDKIISVTSK